MGILASDMDGIGGNLRLLDLQPGQKYFHGLKLLLKYEFLKVKILTLP